jgi:hypothetical protein
MFILRFLVVSRDFDRKNENRRPWPFLAPLGTYRLVPPRTGYTVFDKNPKTELAPNFSPKPEKNEKPSPKWAKP